MLTYHTCYTNNIYFNKASSLANKSAGMTLDKYNNLMLSDCLCDTTVVQVDPFLLIRSYIRRGMTNKFIN